MCPPLHLALWGLMGPSQGCTLHRRLYVPPPAPQSPGFERSGRFGRPRAPHGGALRATFRTRICSFRAYRGCKSVVTDLMTHAHGLVRLPAARITRETFNCSNPCTERGKMGAECKGDRLIGDPCIVSERVMPRVRSDTKFQPRPRSEWVMTHSTSGPTATSKTKRSRRPLTVTLRRHRLWTRHKEHAKPGDMRTRSPSAWRESSPGSRESRFGGTFVARDAGRISAYQCKVSWPVAVRGSPAWQLHQPFRRPRAVRLTLTWVQ